MTYNKVSKWRIVLDSVKLILPLMAYLAGLIAFLSWLPNRNLFTVTLTIVIGSLIFKVVGEIKAHKTPVLLDYVKSVGVTILYVVGFWFLIKWLGAYGLIGTIIIVLVYAGFRLLRNRKGYLDAMRTVETMVFGKTLDKKKNKKEDSDGWKKNLITDKTSPEELLRIRKLYDEHNIRMEKNRFGGRKRSDD